MRQAIAAVATGHGRAAIGVIRLSGEGCIRCAGSVFRPADGSVFGGGREREMTLGLLLDAQGKPLDQAMAVFFKAPRSYTGEDCCELHCHGSPTVLTLALEALFAQGVRQAEAGEFTKRAFLNGKLDLTRAEAVADLIDAQTPAAARQAVCQLSGALQRKVEETYGALVDLLAHFHAALDYPDEDLAPLTDPEIARALGRARGRLTELLATYDRGRVIRDGVPAVIVGQPNVGKSTLLNALVGYERAIVADLPGTTRDTVEAQCVLGGVLLRLTDTAGVRQTEDPVERLGVERARQAMRGAGLILVLADGRRDMDAGDVALWQEAQTLAPAILLRTKTDLASPGAAPGEGLGISAKADPQGAAAALGRAVAARFPMGAEGPGELLTNARQADCARRALAALERAEQALGDGTPPDMALLDVEEGVAALGSLTGRNLREDVVERIFERFCVGK